MFVKLLIQAIFLIKNHTSYNVYQICKTQFPKSLIQHILVSSNCKLFSIPPIQKLQIKLKSTMERG